MAQGGRSAVQVSLVPVRVWRAGGPPAVLLREGDVPAGGGAVQLSGGAVQAGFRARLLAGGIRAGCLVLDTGRVRRDRLQARVGRLVIRGTVLAFLRGLALVLLHGR